MSNPNFLMPLDWDALMADNNVERMTDAEFRSLMLLLWKAWNEQPVGTLPDDDAVLAAWSRRSLKEWKKLRVAVQRCFQINKEGRWYSEKMMKVHQKILADREANSNRGRRGASVRWHNAQAMPEHPPEQCSSNAQAMPEHPPEQCSSNAQAMPDTMLGRWHLNSKLNVHTPLPPLSGGEAAGEGTESIPNLEGALAFFEKFYAAIYTPDLVRRAWHELNSSRDDYGRWVWRKKVVGDWRSAIIACIEWFNRPANPVAQRLALESEQKNLKTLIDTHVANEQSTSYRDDCNPEERRDLKQKKARYREITEELAGCKK